MAPLSRSYPGVSGGAGRGSLQSPKKFCCRSRSPPGRRLTPHPRRKEENAKGGPGISVPLEKESRLPRAKPTRQGGAGTPALRAGISVSCFRAAGRTGCTSNSCASPSLPGRRPGPLPSWGRAPREKGEPRDPASLRRVREGSLQLGAGHGGARKLRARPPPFPTAAEGRRDHFTLRAPRRKQAATMTGWAGTGATTPPETREASGRRGGPGRRPPPGPTPAASGARRGGQGRGARGRKNPSAAGRGGARDPAPRTRPAGGRPRRPSPPAPA